MDISSLSRFYNWVLYWAETPNGGRLIEVLPDFFVALLNSSPCFSDPPLPMANPLRRLYDWVLHWAETPYGTSAMAVTNVCNMEPGLSCRNPRAADALVAALPYLRDFLTTCGYYLVGPEDR